MYGTERADGYTTTARSRLEGLDINGVVTADVVESVLESRHSLTGGSRDEGEIRVSSGDRRSQIKGLRINKVSVTVNVSDTFDIHTRFEDLRNFLGQKQGLSTADTARRQSFCDMSLLERPEDKEVPDYVDDLCRFQRDDLLRCSILQSIEPAKPKGLEVHGYSILVPNFGRLFLGELLVSRGQKRLNMIRFDLGCDTSGGGIGGGSGVDGEPLP